MNTVTFNTPFNHVITQQKTTTISTLTIIRMIDNPVRKFVAVETKEMGRVTLWEGQAYDAIGQWTDSDVAARLHELYGQ